MRQRVLYSAIALAFAVVLVKLGSGPVIGQTQPAPAQTTAAASGPTPMTPWGEPDFQGIWAIVSQIPLERPSEYAGREFFTDEEIAQIDQQRAALPRRDARSDRGSEADVAGAYNAVFNNFYPAGRRTSLIVDPPDGQIPPSTPAVQERMRQDQEYRGALNQATEACRQQAEACAGATYGPPSPRRAEVPPSYQVSTMNRADHPEDTGLQTRCLIVGLPDLGNGNLNFGGSFRRVVQSPGVVSIYLDLGQGQGFHPRDPDHHTATSPGEDPPMVGRLAWALGREHVGCGRDELHRQVGLPRLAREPASYRALYAHGARHDGLLRHAG